MEARIRKLLGKLNEEKLDAYLITSYENYRYFSGFTGSNCALVITDGECFALTDGRYDIQIREQTKSFTITIISRPMHEHISEILGKYTRVGYETDKIFDSEIRKLRDGAPGTTFVPCPDYGEEIRAIKDKGEIEAISAAVHCSDMAFLALVPNLLGGMTERDAAALLEYEMARRKSRAPAFDTIAASGLHSALPHAEPRDVEICPDSLMTFDFGATVGGYMSDITRTVHIGNPSRELCDLWDLVFEVQQKCIANIRTGMRACELDLYQRSLFEARGMEKYVMHSLGHGVGLAIHEAPTVSKKSETILSENMIITIEPGLYIEGLGGCRIEDTVLITKDGGVALTRAPHRVNIKF